MADLPALTKGRVSNTSWGMIPPGWNLLDVIPSRGFLMPVVYKASPKLGGKTYFLGHIQSSEVLLTRDLTTLTEVGRECLLQFDPYFINEYQRLSNFPGAAKVVEMFRKGVTLTLSPALTDNLSDCSDNTINSLEFRDGRMLPVISAYLSYLRLVNFRNVARHIVGREGLGPDYDELNIYKFYDIQKGMDHAAEIVHVYPNSCNTCVDATTGFRNRNEKLASKVAWSHHAYNGLSPLGMELSTCYYRLVSYNEDAIHDTEDHNRPWYVTTQNPRGLGYNHMSNWLSILIASECANMIGLYRDDHIDIYTFDLALQEGDYSWLIPPNDKVVINRRKRNIFS